MTEKDITALKLDVAKDHLRTLVSKILVTQERIMFLNAQYEEISKKPAKELTETEKKIKQEHKANIATFKEGVKEAQVHEKNFRLMRCECANGRQNTCAESQLA
jgi:gas vesicle protein